MNKHAVTSVPVLDQIKERWSPRAFVEGYQIPDETLSALILEELADIARIA